MSLFEVETESETRRLIENGVDVNARDSFQNTPLHDARTEGIAKILIENGADMNCAPDFKIFFVQEFQSKEFLTFCLEYGADLEVEDVKGRKLIDLVKPDIKKWLIEEVGVEE